MHNGRTGRATLRLAATVTGMPMSRAEECWTRRDDRRSTQRVGTYSLGMRQRLG